MMMGDVDEKTNARRGGCLGCVLGDEDPASPGTRKGGTYCAFPKSGGTLFAHTRR